MKLPRQFQTVVVLTVGAMLGYLAALGSPRTAVQAETIRPASGLVVKATTKASAIAAPC